MYRNIAPYYDQVFDFASPWGTPARNRILGRILPEVSSACDLACGTGTTAIELARRGIPVYAVDLSPAMCRMARAKIRHENARHENAGREKVQVTVVEADMRTFRLPSKVDLVTCEFDAINHVPRKSDLARVARAVARALNPAGYFYFDVNTLASFENMWPLSWWVEKPGLVLITHGGFDAAAGKAFTTAEIFVRGRGNNWKRLSDKVEEVCWTPQEIYSTLDAAGFGQVHAHDSKELFQRDPLVRRGYRTYYLARLAQ
jgi:SAM-dependent methyltransferase